MADTLRPIADAPNKMSSFNLLFLIKRYQNGKRSGDQVCLQHTLQPAKRAVLILFSRFA
jgi:hypothetical protein